MTITTQTFGNGATLYTLTNKHNVSLSATDLGARIVNWYIPTTQGTKNIVLGFDSSDDYQTIDSYLGATIGRVAGRITNGTFTIDDTEYHVTTQSDQNNNTLHGGPDSFETKIWHTTINDEHNQLIFTYNSSDSENGFPGNLEVQVSYTLTDDNEWLIDYHATTDQATLFNPTNHVYFNLTGNPEETIHEHTLQLASETFAVINKDVTVTGEKRNVGGTPFDFRQPRKIAQIYDTDYEQNVLVGGLDHPFFLEKTDGPQATLTSPTGDIKVEMTTDEEAVVIFSANFGPDKTDESKKLTNFTGITLETQAAPGAIEFDDFGDIILRPNKAFHSKTCFKVQYT
ncbi:aldose epimerase family protein [Vagococcus xieshaowenii]|uniref:Aldose 1-epimerase n=1 Tax=Vagococcus xieshaowenii TaxID=2562451 RepID=A0AAJ5JLV9_9ENTE|nr:aldose epimerase family protein [Vagococcus xieshaowenii]QCA29356.1 galactose mutarotase [Vagococcus xieshaowenii]TFZ39352.1 galactose mutarotase [Vagococcus xieshaowenii]